MGIRGRSICDRREAGTPAVRNTESQTCQAFLNLAQAVVTVTNRRNKELPKTRIVDISKK